MENNKQGTPRPKLDLKTAKRVFGYMTKSNKVFLVIVVICIIVNTIANTAASLYLENLIDNYITPLIGQENPVLAPFFKAVGVMALLYILGVLTIFIYTRVMVRISQGTLKKIRDDMFEKMQKLPIKYFDTHSHGDIMSRYTNDTDTLSQMISQSIPQMFSVIITIVVIFVSMIVTNIYLTLVVIAFLGIKVKPISSS